MKTSEFDIKTNLYGIPCRLFEPDSMPDFIAVGVHGFAGDKESSVLTALAAALCENNGALICFDFPAHGQSKADDKHLRVENCNNDLMAVVNFVRERYPNKKYGVFATSFGGYITLLNAEKLKDFNIVLRAPALTIAESFIKKIIPVSEKEFFEAGGATCGYERKMFVCCDFYRDLIENPVKIPSDPIMIIHGTEDNIVPYQSIKEAAEKSPNITLITAEGADHRFKRPGELEFITEKALNRFLNIL